MIPFDPSILTPPKFKGRIHFMDGTDWTELGMATFIAVVALAVLWWQLR